VVPTGLYGPYDLSTTKIDALLTSRAPGAYALGSSWQGTFYINYVGRSDDDLAGRLKQHVGRYAQFQCIYLGSAKAAFDKECQLYHDFTPPDNQVHPARPKNTNWGCPRCRVFG
jgi:hypothetical protein